MQSSIVGGVVAVFIVVLVVVIASRGRQDKTGKKSDQEDDPG